MADEIYEIYFKDLLKKTQKRIMTFYKKHKVTGLEQVYDSTEPIIILVVFDENDLVDTSAMDNMVS